METISLDLSQELLLAGDIAYLSSLILLALLSWGAGQSIDPKQRVTMQWGLNGKPIWQASRRFALMFTPIIGAFTGLFLSFLAHQSYVGLALGLTVELLNMSIIRVGTAVAFVFAHILHLSIIVRDAKK